MTDQHDLILAYLQNQVSTLEKRAQDYIVSQDGSQFPHRDVFQDIGEKIELFQSGNIAYRWLIVYGLRGVGKTTLSLQAYNQIRVPSLRKIYVSVDEVTRQLGIRLYDLLAVYEELLGTVFENLTEPVYIFLDEVQYDPDWAITLKTVYDRSSKVFVCATGSSSVLLQTNPDVNRRAIFEPVYPLSFTEYLRLKENRPDESGLRKIITKTLFHSQNAEEVFSGLQKIRVPTQQYWAGINRLGVDAYIKTGTLPFTLRLGNDGVAYDQLKKTVDSIITKDIPQLETFDSSVIACIPRLLYTLANTDVIPVSTLSRDLQLSRITVNAILDVLEKTGLIIRITPFGSRSKQVRKPSKYLFSSPAFRSMYLNFLGSTFTERQIKGKFYEDLIGMYLQRYFTDKALAYSLTYDSSEGGADFILGLKESGEYIALEVSAGKKNFEQLRRTSKKFENQFKYGMNLSMSELAIDTTNNFVSVPLSYFLLI